MTQLTLTGIATNQNRGGYYKYIDKMLYSEGKPSSVLSWATFKGNIGIVELLIAKGANLNVCDDRGYTPLHIASKEGYMDIVKLLINNGADINVQTTDGCRPLYMAALGHNKDIAQTLLDYEAFMEEDIAILLGDLQLVKHYLDLGTDPNSKIEKGLAKGEPWLIAAIGSRNKKVVELLLNYGANIYQKIESKNILPIHRASALGCLEICQLLIAHGTNVDIKGEYKRTSLHCATQSRHQAIVELLLDYNADINALDIEGKSALSIASGHHDLQIVEILLSRGARIYPINDQACNPLICACSSPGGDETIKSLVVHGADTNVRDLRGFSPLHLAVVQNNKGLVEFLLSNGAREGLELT
ncbi:ankyrin repeat domain-containing protein [Crocosphaera sp. Alani8]|uniref:ankyrin repeat domain-containing protein n=1 Tax=Crocosphaera sp. Alani8 TaxID=3038952 RepID=UPI00313E8A17